MNLAMGFLHIKQKAHSKARETYLDRSVSSIKESTKLQDMHIAAIYSRDRAQDKWFLRQGKKLIRVTDKQFKTLIKEGREFDAHVLVSGGN